MKVLLKGNIIDFDPIFYAHINDKGILVLTEKGDLRLTIDTGFSGGIALSWETLLNMDTELLCFDTFTLATGEVVELPVFSGNVIIGDREIETWFIPGDSLLGMEFLYSAGSILSVNFREDYVKLIG